MPTFRIVYRAGCNTTKRLHVDADTAEHATRSVYLRDVVSVSQQCAAMLDGRRGRPQRQCNQFSHETFCRVHRS